MELVAAVWCTRKWLSFDQTIRNFTSGDLGIPLLVTQLGVTRLLFMKAGYSRERMCISRAKICCVTPWERNGNRVSP